VGTEIPVDSWVHSRDELERFARALHPSAKIAVKESKIWNVGALRTFATTIGNTVYFPVFWNADAVRHCLPHEILGHLRQFLVAGFGIHPNIGIPLGLFAYILLPFPILFAWVRYRMELHADAKSWEYHLRSGLWSPDYVMSRAEIFGAKVGGKPYVLSVPKFWAVWGFKRKAKKVIKRWRDEN
jgi:hypothetical protein